MTRLKKVSLTIFDFVTDKLTVQLGSKSVFTFSIFMGSILLFVLNGNYRPEFLNNISYSLGLCLGLFACLVGVLTHYFIWFHYFSKTMIRYSKLSILHAESITLFHLGRHLVTFEPNPDRAARELPRAVCLLMLVVSTGILGLNTLSVHTIDSLLHVQESITLLNSRYCPDLEIEQLEPPMEGCELITRAFQLGYAKSLGPCAPRKIEIKQKAVCLWRRENEPYLHYTYRLIDDFWQTLSLYVSKKFFQQEQEKFKFEYAHLETLQAYHRASLDAKPRSSHHVWTNYQFPHRFLTPRLSKLLDPSSCISRYDQLPHTPKEYRGDPYFKSKGLEHILGQLVFIPRHKDNAGFCKEYTIHWDAPVNACEQLSLAPEKFLKEWHIADEITNLTRRYFGSVEHQRYVNNLKQFELKSPASRFAIQKPLEKKTPKFTKDAKDTAAKTKPHDKIARDLSHLISFQCIMELSPSNWQKTKDAPRQSTFRTLPVQLAGQKIFAHDTKFKEASGNKLVPIELYPVVAKTLAPRFQYTGIESTSKIDPNLDSLDLEEVFEDPQYMMTKLEYFTNTDIFLGNMWILDRSDILEVFPFYAHLYHFVDLFRQSYVPTRGRL